MIVTANVKLKTPFNCESGRFLRGLENELRFTTANAACVYSDSGEVLKQMSAGDFFGEIGILNMDGGINR